MAYSEVPDSNLDVDDPIRSVDIKQLNNNVIDHESRIRAVADPMRLYDHFAEDHGYPSGLIIDETTAQNTKPSTLNPNAAASPIGHSYANERIILYVDDGGGATWTEMIAGSTTDQHFLRCSGGAGALRCTPSIYFNNRTAPVTWETRIKLAANPVASTSMFLGLSDGDGLLGARPSNGIYVEYVSGTNWRFTTSRSGSNTTGTNFAEVTAATWFVLKIIINDDAGTHAECYIDNNLKDDHTLTLPVDRPIWPFLSFNTGSTWDVDYVSLSSGGIDNAA
jgi:hypothetical protein